MDRGILMESLIHVKEGYTPGQTNTRCFFCDQEAPFTFGIIDNTRMIRSGATECYQMNSVDLCTIHAEGFNSLLSGEHDINDLIMVMKKTNQKKINLRR